MDPSINRIKGSDGSANASLATVQSSRAPLSSTISVDTVAGIPDEFMGSMGTPHTFTDPITSETITVISEATCVDFAGHVDGANLEIDEIAPGYTDLGSEVGDIIVIRPTTQYSDNIAAVLAESLEDDGALKDEAIADSLGASKGVFGGLQIYTSSDTWTKPTGLKFIEVTVVAGGGGGGGAASTTGSQASSSVGGGGGGASIKKIAAADLASTVAVTVGAAGTGGSAGANNGTAGGNSSFGAHATATGGSGGLGAAASSSNDTTFGVAGGVGSSGNINIAGGASNAAAVIGGVRIPTGQSGGSIFGGSVPVAAAATGNNAVSFGAGGGGSANNGSQSARAGGNGAAGIVIVREYF